MELIVSAVKVRRGIQDNHVSYISSFTFGDIASMLQDGRLYVPNDPSLADFAQRKPNPKRIKSIAHYILETYENGSTFFPPICVNIQPAPAYSEGKIFMPYYSVSLRLTDGQHRCYGIQQAIQKIQDQSPTDLSILAQVEIGALVYAGLDLDMERQAFRDQNLLAQRPGTSLAYSFDQRSPATLIAKVLLSLVPQFADNVESTENGLGKHNPKLLTFATLVTSTQHMFPNLESCKELESLVDWAASFWTDVAEVLPGNPWRLMDREERKKQRQVSIVGTAVVFQALGMVARDLYLEGITVAELKRWVVKFQELDWSRNHPLWRKTGVTQIGAKEDAIISNTRTTVNACHKVFRELLGVAVADVTV